MIDEVYKIGINRYMHKEASIMGKMLNRASHPHAHTLMEVGGLGAIAAPYVAEEMGKPLNKSTSRRLELAGLGTLAIPSVVDSIKHLRRR